MRMRLLVLVGLVGGLLASLSGSASAAFTYSFAGSLARSGEPFSKLEGSSVAIDDANGNTYVADSGRGEVAVFETFSGTQLASLDGSLTPAGSFGGREVAVAANNATGAVYVLDTTENVVDVFNGTGGYVCQITGSSTPSASECNGAAGSDTPAHGFSGPRGIAVDQATGDIYVLDGEHGALDIFNVGGAYLRQISLASATGFSGLSGHYSRSVAVDDFNGNVYVGDSGSDTVHVFNAAGAYVMNLNSLNTPAGDFGGGWVSVAASDSTGEVYVTDSQHQVTDIFAPAGEYLKQIPESSLEGRGTAIDQATNNLYISDATAGVVYVFDAVLVPDATTGAASNVQPTSVTLNGTINPDGLAVTSCVFEYGTDTSYGQSVPCMQSIGSGTSPVPVSADLSGLQEGTTYHFRLVAENANGPNQGADMEVTVPAPPTISSATIANLDASQVDLSAAINPHAAPSTYHIEYGTSTAYGTSVPNPNGAIAAGITAQTVTQRVRGLQANTTYHWRVVAQNLAGSTTGSDHTFIYTTASAALPDGRAYEMVTPVQKNAALIGFLGNRPEPVVDVAESGSRLVAPVTACFAGAGSCLPQRGITAGASYEFERAAGGWGTSSLSLPNGALENVFLLSADSGKGLLTLPNGLGKEDWYAMGEGGSLAHIGPAGPPTTGRSENTQLTYRGLAATSDMSHVVWSTHQGEYGWPFDPTTLGVVGALSTYEYVGTGGAVPAMVGVTGGAGSTDLASICGTEIPDHQSGVLSADGRTVFFIASACSTGSGANTGVAVPADQLWARIDESRSVRVSERSPSDCSGACATSAEARPEFMGASADGSKAFFTSMQQLTNDAGQDTQPEDGFCNETVGVNGCNLYMYDFSRPAGQSVVDVSAGDSSGGGPRVRGVMSVSADGSHVYFVAQGVLTPAVNDRDESAKSGANNLYVYERDAAHPEGATVFIASLPGTDVEEWRPGQSLANVTPDGRFLVFRSSGDLTADDTSLNGARQLFRYDAQSGQLIRISVGDLGFDDDGNRPAVTQCEDVASCSEDANIVGPQNRFVVFADQRRDPTMSHDGAYVFFTSPVALAPGALDDFQVGASGVGNHPRYAQNVYEWHGGRVYLISDGKDISQHSEFSAVALIGTDATGANVFFSTADPLVAQDTDTQVDIYDARICTLGEPCVQPAAPVEGCQGDSCHAPPSPAPGSVSVASSTLTGAGNLAPAPAVAGHKKAAVKKKKHAKPRKRKRKAKRGHKTRIHRTGGKSGVRS